MELIVKENRARFDSNAIKTGYAIYGKHASWDNGKTGVVTAVTDTTLVALFHPGIGNVINHFIIPIGEVEKGEWDVRWSEDLTTVNELKPEAQDEP